MHSEQGREHTRHTEGIQSRMPRGTDTKWSGRDQGLIHAMEWMWDLMAVQGWWCLQDYLNGKLELSSWIKSEGIKACPIRKHKNYAQQPGNFQGCQVPM